MNERGWKLKVEDEFRATLMQQSVSRRPLVFNSILKTTIWELGGSMRKPEQSLP